MLIQRGSSNKKFGDGDHTDIFYNYFSLGLVSINTSLIVLGLRSGAKRGNGWEGRGQGQVFVIFETILESMGIPS